MARPRQRCRSRQAWSTSAWRRLAASLARNRSRARRTMSLAKRAPSSSGVCRATCRAQRYRSAAAATLPGAGGAASAAGDGPRRPPPDPCMAAWGRPLLRGAAALRHVVFRPGAGCTLPAGRTVPPGRSRNHCGGGAKASVYLAGPRDPGYLAGPVTAGHVAQGLYRWGRGRPAGSGGSPGTSTRAGPRAPAGSAPPGRPARRADPAPAAPEAAGPPPV